jgi:hypothetical protein
MSKSKGSHQVKWPSNREKKHESNNFSIATNKSTLKLRNERQIKKNGIAISKNSKSTGYL